MTTVFPVDLCRLICWKKRILTDVMTILIVILPLGASLSAAEEVRLSSLDLSHVQQGEGIPGMDVSTKGRPDAKGKSLSIAGREYTHGLGTRAPSVLHLDLQGGQMAMGPCVMRAFQFSFH